MSVMADAIESPGWACCLPESIPLSLRLGYWNCCERDKSRSKLPAERSIFSNLVGKYRFHLLLCGFVIRRSWTVSSVTSKLALLFRRIPIILRMRSSNSECE